MENGSSRPTRKTTVEECLTLSIGDFGRLRRGRTGRITWTWPLGRSYSLDFIFDLELRAVWVRYEIANGVMTESQIPLQHTFPNFGGVRWWFSCPAEQHDDNINGRVAKLYLAPNSLQFGCRNCHDLTYQSCQNSHFVERSLARFGQGHLYKAYREIVQADR